MLHMGDDMTLEPLLQASLSIQVHAAAALLALGLGIGQFALKRGSVPHRLVGWGWVALMAATAGSSLFIHELRLVGPWSPIHLLAFTRFLDTVEWLGNLLPHPVTLFALFAVAWCCCPAARCPGLSVPDPRPEGAAGRAPDGMIRVVSLLNAEGLRRIVENLVTNFTGFVPLGTVLVALLGVGVAERSGLLGAAIRAMVLRASRHVSRWPSSCSPACCPTPPRRWATWC
jgi:hypothetical protein